MKELKPLKEMVQVQKPMKEMNEDMEMLVKCMPEFKTKGQGQFSQSEEVEGLFFVNKITSGLKMKNLVETRATHSFVSRRTPKSLHHKPENFTRTRKVLKLAVMPMIGIVRSTTLRVVDWFDSMALLVSPLEYHVMILDLDFLKLAKTTPLIL
jgi:hypothetical protein